jgi:hypothetical protein
MAMSRWPSKQGSVLPKFKVLPARESNWKRQACSHKKGSELEPTAIFLAELNFYGQLFTTFVMLMLPNPVAKSHPVVAGYATCNDVSEVDSSP